MTVLKENIQKISIYSLRFTKNCITKLHSHELVDYSTYPPLGCGASSKGELAHLKSSKQNGICATESAKVTTSLSVKLGKCFAIAAHRCISGKITHFIAYVVI
jgi:hypothetical protein